MRASLAGASNPVASVRVAAFETYRNGASASIALRAMAASGALNYILWVGGYVEGEGGGAESVSDVTRVIQILSKCGILVGLTACGSADDSALRASGFGGAAAFGGSSVIMGATGGTFSGNGGVGASVTGGFGGLPSGGVASTGGASGGNDGTCFPSVTDYTAAGSFTPTSGDVASVACTLFRPTVLGAGGCKHPVIVWGNGTFNTPANYTAMFNHFASQGFIVAAADTSNAGSGKEMLACLKYVLDENGSAGSPYEGHVDVDHIASSGYSQGGAGCLEAGIDPRFTVTAPVSPYIVLPLGGYDAGSVAKQIHPMFMISGSADTVAVPSANQQPIFQQAPVPIVWATHAGSSHLEVLGAGGGAYAGPLTAWFRYKLMGDASAGQWFEKPACTLCSAAGWSVQFK